MTFRFRVYGRARRTWTTGVALAASLLLAVSLGAQEDDELDDEASRVERLREVISQTLGKDRRRRRPSVLGDVHPRLASEHDRKVARVLRRTRVRLTFDKARLGDVLDTFREVSALTFVVSGKASRELEKAKAKDEEVEISLSVRKLPLENVLNLLSLKLRAYRFAVRDGAVVLVHDSEYRPRRYLRVYDVTDLVRPRRHFRAPRLGLDLPGES
ncbi:MAG: hypothetical protein O7J95_07655 [Planctomycetota bacterium]|nr:hypothetical protein [Planctomycetota bacterium]